MESCRSLVTKGDRDSIAKFISSSCVSISCDLVRCIIPELGIEDDDLEMSLMELAFSEIVPHDALADAAGLQCCLDAIIREIDGCVKRTALPDARRVQVTDEAPCTSFRSTTPPPSFSRVSCSSSNSSCGVVSVAARRSQKWSSYRAAAVVRSVSAADLGTGDFLAAKRMRH